MVLNLSLAAIESGLMDRITHGFADELTKMSSPSMDKEAVDPFTLATSVVAGKLGLSNLLTRYGHKIKPIRAIGQGITGAGARAGMAGRPMLSRPTREIGAFLGDAKLMKLYEDGHAAGSLLRKNRISAKGASKLLSEGSAKARKEGFDGVAEAVDLAKGVPLEATSRLQRAVDYGHRPAKDVLRDLHAYGNKPVSEVGRDIGSGAKKVYQRARDKLRPSRE